MLEEAEGEVIHGASEGAAQGTKGGIRNVAVGNWAQDLQRFVLEGNSRS